MRNQATQIQIHIIINVEIDYPKKIRRDCQHENSKVPTRHIAQDRKGENQELRVMHSEGESASEMTGWPGGENGTNERGV